MRCVLSEIGRTKGTIGDMDPVKTVQKTAVPSDLLKSSFGIASTTQRKAPNSILMSAKRYGIALGIFVAATLVRMAIDPVVGDLHPFVTYNFAIILTAWYCGVAPSVVSLLLGLMAAAYFFATPRGSVFVRGVDVQVGMLLYVVVGLSSIIFNELMHSANRRAEATADALRSNQLSLESEITRRRQAESETVALLRRIVNLQEEERKRISLELHDQCGQDLVAMQLSIQLAIHHASNNNTTEGIASLEDSKAILEKLSKELHTLAFDLRPLSLDEFGLRTTTESLLASWAERTKIAVDFECHNWDKNRMIPEVSLALYRAIQESLNNIAKHANCSHVGVVLEMKNNQVVAIIEDNGSGFHVDDTMTSKAGTRLGIQGMKERLESVGGSLEIESNIGLGTTVFVRAPLLEKGVDGA